MECQEGAPAGAPGPPKGGDTMAGRPLNATAASLLGFLHQGPLTGWDLVQTGERGPRDRRPYSLTEAGRRAFAEWVRREPGPETIRFPLLLTVLFGGHLPDEVLRGFLERHRAVHAERLGGYERQQRAAVAAGASERAPYPLATLE